MVSLFTKQSYRPRSSCPSPFRPTNQSVAECWGSRSNTSTFLFSSPIAAATFTAVVVLPAPPFWFIIAIILMRSFRPLHARQKNNRRTQTVQYNKWKYYVLTQELVSEAE